MKKYFVPYDIAVALKELGFDEQCIAIYNDGDILLINQSFTLSEHYFPELDTLNFNVDDADIPAPVYDQVIDWFMEKHGIPISAKMDMFLSWLYSLEVTSSWQGDFTSRYEALNAGILKAIELVKTTMKVCDGGNVAGYPCSNKGKLVSNCDGGCAYPGA